MQRIAFLLLLALAVLAGCKRDQRLRPWDPTGANEGPVQTGLQGVVSLGGFHACRLQANGTVKCEGLNSTGQLGNGSTSSATVAVNVSNLSSASFVSAGGYHTCAVKTDGTLWCWGLNDFGQLGDGTTINRSSPVQVSSLGTSVASVAAGESFTCALKTDGSVWCVGGNWYGQLGNGTGVDSTTFVKVSSLGTSVASVAAGMGHACAVKTDGTLWCWGYNVDGELGVSPKTNRLSPVNAPLPAGVFAAQVDGGVYHTLVLTTSGTAYAAGKNIMGGLADGSNTGSAAFVQVVMGSSKTPVTGLTAVAAGQDASAFNDQGANAGFSGKAQDSELGNAQNANPCYPNTGSVNSTDQCWGVEWSAALAGTVTAVDVGYTRACALTGSSVKCMGYDPAVSGPPNATPTVVTGL